MTFRSLLLVAFDGPRTGIVKFLACKSQRSLVYCTLALGVLLVLVSLATWLAGQEGSAEPSLCSLFSPLPLSLIQKLAACLFFSLPT